MKLAVGILFSVMTIVAWEKPGPQTAVLFDFQNGVDHSLIKTEGAAVYQLAGRLRIGVANPGDGAPSAFLLPRHGHWDLSRYRYLEVDVHNVGRVPASVSAFAFVPGGFGGISTYPQHETGREVLSPEPSARCASTCISDTPTIPRASIPAT